MNYLDKIRYVVQYYYGVGEDQFFSPSREGRIVAARKMVSYIGYFTTPLNYDGIAQYIEQCNHTLARHHTVDIKNRISQYANTQEDVLRIMVILLQIPRSWEGSYLDFKKFILNKPMVSVSIGNLTDV
jgi:chromosomal replication initiation ATPase DnaA